ncbi:hypothetical protein IL306_007330, partial [Fusarium sp. DS 682]
LATNIYGSGARFVFELLQNAEDNRFVKAIGQKALPFISFKIYPNHIVVECNEDGFTRPDMEAICSVGESSKSAMHGYIGAKGIGFKSVFIAASRVHIQSGNFSFEFRHNKTDPGLGMVRPIWVPPTESIPSPLTRTTLYLHDQGDEEELQHLRTIISMQFDDLQETCLLFLRKLRQISVAFYDEEGKVQRSKQFQKHDIDDHRVSLDTTTIIDGEETVHRQIYHITKKLATGLAPSDNREPPKNEEARRYATTAEVVLAFPLTSDYKPLISYQRQGTLCIPASALFGLQNIITTSRRNLNIRDWIADVFYQAILQFCEHPTLCYHWPLFLPSRDTRSDSFWSGLNTSLQRLIKTKPVLKSRNLSSLRAISDVVILPSSNFDENGEPLFDDPVKDPFLSAKYPSTVTTVLKQYGLFILHFNTLIDLVESDLARANSKMRGKNTTDEWHTAAANALSGIFGTQLDGEQKLKRLSVIPLRDGSWTAITNGKTYFPTTGETEIPKSLDLRVICSATTNPARRNFFQRLGVSEATVTQVRESILGTFGLPRDFEILNSYLHYLYLTHQAEVHTRKHYDRVQVVSTEWTCSSPHNKVIYFPDTSHPYSPKTLLAPEGAAPGLSANFLHLRVLEEAPIQPGLLHIPWKTWLRDCVGIHERLSLLSPDRQALSEPFRYVFNHRPDKFLGLFEQLWVHEGRNLLKSRGLVSIIQLLPAKRLCGVNFATDLKSTWLPLPNLKQCVERYMEHPDQFPFLKIEGCDTNREPGSKWNFLAKHFGVGQEEDIEFLLEILTCIKRSCPIPSSVRQSQRVEFFEESGILAPYEKEPSWTTSSSCVWASPPDMVMAHSLKSLYMRSGLSDEDMTSIENLFHRTLGIKDVTMNDLVVELGMLRDADCEEHNRIRDLYIYMSKKLPFSLDIRTEFEQCPLIFARQLDEPGWYKTSDCLWSSTTRIRGKVTLDESYEELKDFFVGKLGVKSLTLQMVYNELKESPRSSVEDIKVAILSLNDFLQSEEGHWDPEPIRQAKVFPVKYPNGSISLSSVGVEFAIADRDNLRSKFEDKIALLDFDLEDVHRLKSYFAWLKIETRYLSRCVKEDTAISGESGSPILSHKRDLRLKAYHIARVAATFRSPRFQHDGSSLYRQLRAMTVKEVDEITSILKISQNGQLHTAELSTASEHITEPAGELVIFVPRDRKAQEICFGSVLPRKFAAWLMRHPVSQIDGNVEVDAVTALTSIFASDRSVLDEILDDQGIIQVAFGNEEDESDDGEDDGYEQEEEHTSDQARETGDVFSEPNLTPTHSSENGFSSPHAASPGFEPQAGLIETVVETFARQSNMSHQARPGPALHSSQRDSPSSPQVHTNLSSGYPSSASQAAEDARYLSILDKVIEAARRANFPSGGAFDLQDLRDALPGGYSDVYESFDGLNALNRFRSTSQQERDKKIGVAGELYVFELLSKLELPGWGRGNWQSTIRTRETADMVYADSQGQLTDTLIDAGILVGDEWTGKRPKYFIEVNTTSGPCKTPFYMSGNQYRLMERIHYNQDRTEVYMAFRVYFLLDSSRINYCVYLDPKKLKDDGQLLFAATTWSVTPGSNE